MNDPERCTDDVPVQEPEPGQKPEPELVAEGGNRRYPSREHRKPKCYGDYVLDESAKYTVDYCFRVADVPKTYTDAMRSVESDKWSYLSDDQTKSVVHAYDTNRTEQ